MSKHINVPVEWPAMTMSNMITTLILIPCRINVCICYGMTLITLCVLLCCIMIGIISNRGGNCTAIFQHSHMALNIGFLTYLTPSNLCLFCHLKSITNLVSVWQSIYFLKDSVETTIWIIYRIHMARCCQSCTGGWLYLCWNQLLKKEKSEKWPHRCSCLRPTEYCHDESTCL